MHHDVCRIVVAMNSFPPEKNAGIRVHGGLVGGNRPVELPHDDGFWVVKKIMANTRDMLSEGDIEGLELGAGTDAREEKEAGGVDGAGAEDCFFLRAES